jgi:hypothetical protein
MHFGTSRGKVKLAEDEKYLMSDRNAVYSSIKKLQHVLHSTNLPRIKLTTTP